MRIEERNEPPLTVLQSVYRYAVVPIYTVFPKPGELGSLISYVLTDEETTTPGPPQTADSIDLRAARQTPNVWGPLWSSLAFVVVVLAITCIRLQRVDI